MFGRLRRWFRLLRWEQWYSSWFEYWLGHRAAHRQYRKFVLGAQDPLIEDRVEPSPYWVYLECACPCECPNEYNYQPVLHTDWRHRCLACMAADKRFGRLPHPPIPGVSPDDVPVSSFDTKDGISHYQLPARGDN